MAFGSFPVTESEVASRSILTFTDEEQQSLAAGQYGGVPVRYTSYRQMLRALGTPEATKAMELASWYSKFFSFIKSDFMDARTHTYVASMLCPKPDPMGRHTLVNVHTKLTPDDNIEWRVLLYLAGATNTQGDYNIRANNPASGVVLGEGYTHHNEMAAVREKPELWLRAHSPGGVSYAASATDSGPGLGFLLYTGMALISRIYYGATGCYSFGSRAICGNYRSDEANAFWARQVERKFAKRVRNMERGDCSTTFMAETINADDVMKTGLVVLLAQPAHRMAQNKGIPVGPWQMPAFRRNALQSWTGDGNGGIASTLLRKPMRDEKLREIHTDRADALESMAQKYGIYFKDGTPTYPLPQRGIKKKAALRLELLKRAYHGESPVLTFLIMDMLAFADTTAAVDYATRPDIARMIADSEPAKALLARLTQRRVRGTAGLAGLSDYELREVVQAVTYAGAGRMPIDHDSDNPLHLPPMPTAIKRELEQYGD